MLVKRLSERYTGKGNTSVTCETANKLMEAVYYCIGMCERYCGEEGEAGVVCTERATGTAAEAYDAGYHLILEKAGRVRDSYNQWIGSFNSYGNIALADTVEKGIPEFFKWYDARFAPMDSIILFDYPVLEDLSWARGIEKMERYMDCIRKEQIFLGWLHEDFVRKCLESYQRGYRELVINLSAIVIKKILCRLMIGVRADKLRLEEEDFERLSQALQDGDREGLERRIHGLLEVFMANAYPGEGWMRTVRICG